MNGDPSEPVSLSVECRCGQAMHPRVATCCRVPCLQNYTTYFDSKGNPDGCYTHPYVAMAVPIGGFALLGVSLFWLLCLCIFTKSLPRYSNINYIIHGMDTAQQAAVDSVSGKSKTGNDNDQVSRNAADVEQVQIL